MALGAQTLLGTARVSASKPLKVIFFGSLIGVVDGLQARYFTIGSFGNGAGILYQACYLAAAGATAYFGLRDRTWSAKRNMLNLMMSIPVAMLGDNVSIDVQKLRLYFLLIPKDGFLWRDDLFGHTFLSPVANWVNQQTLTNGFIDGYLASIGIAGGYVALQYFWSRHNNRNDCALASVL
jgi:hypothetical protein